MKATVIVTLKPEVSDPQGLAVGQAMQVMGCKGLEKVRIGKFIEIELDGVDRADAEKQLNEASEKLLSNPVIEDFRLEFTEG